MEIINSGTELERRINYLKAFEKVIGFVPTMGSLHQGHLSLIKIAKQYSDVVVCSIYINPTQFNDQKDFELYPKNLESDLILLEKSGCDIVFTPENNTVYPNGVNNIEYDIGDLGFVMEGKFRSGHFNGVIQVVKRLFDLVNPDVAVFGQKDFQQLAVIRWLVGFFNLNIKIIGGPIVREPDGLAMSSRNERLSNNERKIAIKLSETLFYIRDNYKDHPAQALINTAIERLNHDENIELEYLEIADTTTLQPVNELDFNRSTGVFIAAKVGKIRLIDNVVLF